MKVTIRKNVTVTLALTLVFSLYATTQSIPAYASDLIDESVSPSSDLPGQLSTYSVKFKAHTLKAILNVEIIIPDAYDTTGAAIVNLVGFRPGTFLSKVNNPDATQSLIVQQLKPNIFRSSVEKIIEIGSLKNPVTEGPHAWTIKTFDRTGSLVDMDTVMVTLKNVEITGRNAGNTKGAGVQDPSNTTTGSKATSFDLTLDNLLVNNLIQVGTTSLLLTSNKIDTSATGGDDDLTVAVAGTTRMTIEESPGTVDGTALVRIAQASLAANTLMFEIRDLDAAEPTVFKVDKEGDVTLGSLIIKSKTPKIFFNDTDTGEGDATIGIDADEFFIDVDDDMLDGNELRLDEDGVLTVGSGTIKLEGNSDKIVLGASSGDPITLEKGSTLLGDNALEIDEPVAIGSLLSPEASLGPVFQVAGAGVPATVSFTGVGATNVLSVLGASAVALMSVTGASPTGVNIACVCATALNVGGVTNIGGVLNVAGAVNVVGAVSVGGAVTAAAIAAPLKAAIVNTDSYGTRYLWTVESGTYRFMDEGIGTLSGGSATIFLDPIYLETVEGDFMIHVTPYGNTTLYVDERGPNYFVVKSTDGTDVEFAWYVSAIRNGWSGINFPESIPDPAP